MRTRKLGFFRRAAAGVVIVCGLIVTGLLVGGTALSSTSTKYYSAAVTPATAPGGSPSPFTVTITNCGAGAPCNKASTQSLGSANITFPARFTLGTVTQPVASGNKPWTATVVGNVIQLRNPGPNNTNALAPGELVSVTVLATPTGCGSYSVTSQAKQSNDFSGTGNDFTLVGGQPSVNVAPGSLDHFGVATIPSPETAGTGFTVTATAFDSCGNVDTGYTGGATLSGNLAAAPDTMAPSYGPFGTWTHGSASASVTAFASTSYNSSTHAFNADDRVTVADGSAIGTSNVFAVQPGPLASLTWTQQPTETAKSANISPAPGVTATDAHGNPIPGVSVGVTLNTISGSGQLTGTQTATTDNSGVATFASLAVDDAGEYTLTAANGGFQPVSNPFVIANQISPCTGSCTASGSVKTNTTTDASVTGANAGSLAVSVILGLTPPLGVCGNKTPLGAGSIVQILNGGSTDAPNFTVTWTLDKSIVNNIPDNGASHFDICLGAEDLTNKNNNPPETGWTTKDGTSAVPVDDPVLGVTLFWGILPNCPNQGTPTGPCVLSKSKDKAGDEVIKFYKPHPWDGSHFGV